MISQVNRDEMRQRLLARAKSSGRVDDEEAVIEKRLNTYLGRSRDIGFTGSLDGHPRLWQFVLRNFLWAHSVYG